MKPKIGYWVKFRATTKSGRHTAIRKIIALERAIGVRFESWNPFWVGAFAGDKILKIGKTKESVK